MWTLVHGALLAQGQVPRTTKELGALAAVAAGRAADLEALLRDTLTARGIAPEILDDLTRDGATTRLPERTQAVVAFVARAALQPTRLSPADYTHLRRLGLDEPELAELVTAASAVGLLIGLDRAL